jgi:hypothetical protein
MEIPGARSVLKGLKGAHGIVSKRDTVGRALFGYIPVSEWNADMRWIVKVYLGITEEALKKAQEKEEALKKAQKTKVRKRVAK